MPSKSPIEHAPNELRPTIGETFQHHDEIRTASRKEVALLIREERQTVDRLFLGDRERWFSVANACLRSLPQPLADDIASYLTRGTPYRFSRGTQAGQGDDAMGMAINLDQSTANLLAAVHACGDAAAIVATANHIKRLADQIIAAAQEPTRPATRAG